MLDHDVMPMTMMTMTMTMIVAIMISMTLTRVHEFFGKAERRVELPQKWNSFLERCTVGWTRTTSQYPEKRSLHIALCTKRI